MTIKAEPLKDKVRLAEIIYGLKSAKAMTFRKDTDMFVIKKEDVASAVKLVRDTNVRIYTKQKKCDKCGMRKIMFFDYNNKELCKDCMLDEAFADVVEKKDV